MTTYREEGLKYYAVNSQIISLIIRESIEFRTHVHSKSFHLLTDLNITRKWLKAESLSKISAKFNTYMICGTYKFNSDWLERSREANRISFR